MEAEDRVKGSQRFREAQNASQGKGFIQQDTMNRILIVVAIAFGAFLLGFAPMWLTSTGYKDELQSVVKTLRSSVLQNNLATATINARRGEFERAREQTSSFFTDLRAELDRKESSFGAEQHESVQSILEQRDETITLLARNDPAGADRLTELYFIYMQVKNTAGLARK